MVSHDRTRPKVKQYTMIPGWSKPKTPPRTERLYACTISQARGHQAGLGEKDRSCGMIQHGKDWEAVRTDIRKISN